jgi:hypothetical protein
MCGGDAPVQRIDWGGGGMALHSKEGLRWELPIKTELGNCASDKINYRYKEF